MPTEAESIAALADKARTPIEPFKIVLDSGREYLFAQADLKQIDVTDPARKLALPAQIAQSVSLQTADALIEYLRLYKTTTTVVFADVTANRLVGVIDYHHASDGAESAQAELLLHRATLVLPYSEEWKIWTGVSGKLMPQLDFARFLEENAVDIDSPPAGQLLDAVRDLHAIRRAEFKRAVRTNTDEETFEYSEETTATTRAGSVALPTKFTLSIPVYFGGEPVLVTAFLRWNLDDGKLMLGVKLQRQEFIRQAEFGVIVARVADTIARPAILGTL